MESIPLVGSRLDREVSKSNRESTGSTCQTNDSNRQPPTAHLHRQGKKKEEERNRTWRWKRDVVQGYLESMPHLNTRVDLTLKNGIQVTTSESIKSPAMTCSSRLMTASGAPVDQKAISSTWGFTQCISSRMWIPTSEDLIYRDVARFLGRLNAAVLKRFRKRKHLPRLSALVVLEYGPNHRRPHLHALIERPAFINEKAFALKIRGAWLAQAVANRQMKIEPVESLPASLLYNTKEEDALANVIYRWNEPDEAAYWRH
jgi:hypothetical protein